MNSPTTSHDTDMSLARRCPPPVAKVVDFMPVKFEVAHSRTASKVRATNEPLTANGPPLNRRVAAKPHPISDAEIYLRHAEEGWYAWVRMLIEYPATVCLL